MTTKDEKQRRRSITQQYKQSEIKKSLASCPLTESDLRALLDYVDEHVGEEGCDHQPKRTRSFMESRALPAEAATKWLNEHGGFCDCEIANVEDSLGWIK